jgi:hypothetical protein
MYDRREEERDIEDYDLEVDEGSPTG